MKKILVILFAISVFSGFAYSQSKIGVIDAEEIMTKSKRGAQIQKTLQTLYKTISDDLKKNQDQIKALEKELSNPVLNQQVREQKSAELERARTEFKRRAEDADNSYRRESESQLSDFEKEISPLINQHGKANGFSAIYDLSRAGIVYFDSAINITGDIIKALDAKTP